MSMAGPTRRLVLAGTAGAVAAALTGCVRGASPEPPVPGSRRPARAQDPDQAIRRVLAIGTLSMIARYHATATRHPALRDRLAGFIADHRAHLAALTGVRTAATAPEGSGSSPDSAATYQPGWPVIRIAANPATAVRDLAGAESDAAAYRSELVGTVMSASFATLLAAIAASQLTHSGLLRSGGRYLAVDPAPAGRLPEGPLGSATVDALQEALAAEHAAVFGYGSLGAWLTGGALARAHEAYDAHRRRRDRLDQFIRRAGAEPQPAAPAYRLPFAVSSDGRARRLATDIEDGVADAYGWLVAAADRGSSLRIDAAGWLTEAALRAASWRRASRALPGLPEAH